MPSTTATSPETWPSCSPTGPQPWAEHWPSHRRHGPWALSEQHWFRTSWWCSEHQALLPVETMACTVRTTFFWGHSLRSLIYGNPPRHLWLICGTSVFLPEHPSWEALIWPILYQWTLCCFKPPNWCYFVTAARGNWYLSQTRCYFNWS